MEEGGGILSREAEFAARKTESEPSSSAQRAGCPANLSYIDESDRELIVMVSWDNLLQRQKPLNPTQPSVMRVGRRPPAKAPLIAARAEQPSTTCCNWQENRCNVTKGVRRNVTTPQNLPASPSLQLASSRRQQKFQTGYSTLGERFIP
jgi:hypothetical protein